MTHFFSETSGLVTLTFDIWSSNCSTSQWCGQTLRQLWVLELDLVFTTSRCDLLHSGTI